MGIFFSSEPESTNKLKDEITKLEERLKDAQSSNWEIQQENKKLLDQIAAQAEAMDEISAKAVAFDRIKAELDSLKDTATQLEAAKARIAELEKAALTPAPVPPPFNNSTTPEPPSQSAEPASVSLDLGPIANRLERIEKYLDDNAYKDGIIKKLHTDLQERSGDFLGQLKRPYLKSIIRIHERLSNTLDASTKPEAMADTEALAKTLKKMNGDVLMVQDMLDDEYDLEYFRPIPGEKYDPRAHNALRSIPAPSPEKAGTIVECRIGGFSEQSTGKVVKAAIVTVYKA